MKKEDIKIGDILIAAEVYGTGDYELTDVEVKSFDVSEENQKVGLEVECEVLSDNEEENRALLITNSECLFHTRLEALQYVVDQIKQCYNHVETELLVAKVDLGAEIERQTLLREKSKRGLNARNSVKLIALLSKKLCDHAFFNDVLKDIGENSEFLKALDVVKVVLFETLNQAEKMGDRLIEAIFGTEEKVEG